MRFLLVFLIPFLCSFSVAGQNKSTIRHGNIDSKIRALLNENTFLSPVETISDFSPLLNLDSVSVKLKDRKMWKTKEQAIRETYRHWVFSVTGGVAIRISPISSKLDDNVIKRKKNLRTGFFICAEAGHFLSENIGIGAKYDYFTTSNTIDDFSVDLPYKQNFRGKIADNINLHFIGPVLLLRSVTINQKIHANCNVSVGYTLYHNKHELNNEPYTITGGNFGFTSGVGVDFILNKAKSVALGLNFGIAAVSIKDISVKNTKYRLDKDNIENLSRISIGATLRLYK